MDDSELFNDMLKALRQAASHHGLTPNDNVMLQLVSVEIEVMALSVLAQRTDPEMDRILEIKLPELRDPQTARIRPFPGFYKCENLSPVVFTGSHLHAN